jgi:hypothetical protein
MADKRISELPDILLSQISPNDVLPIVDIEANETKKISVDNLKSYINSGITDGSTFTGGTISGPTTFTNGLTANTFSAGTYQNLPISGLTAGNNINISGSNGNFTISVTGITGGSTFTGGTVTGSTTFTNGLTANTISATTYQNLPISGLTAGNNISISGSNGNFTISVTGITSISADTYWSSGITGNYSLKTINDSGLEAYGDYSLAEGGETQAYGNYSHAEGYGAKTGWRIFPVTSVSNGLITITGLGDISGEFFNEIFLFSPLNIYTLSSSTYDGTSVLIQLNDTSINQGDWVAPRYGTNNPNATIAEEFGIGSHAEGINTQAIGEYSHAEGADSISFGSASHAEGSQTIAFGDISHAGGYKSIASGATSFIHSTDSVVLGDRSVVLGGENITGTTNDTVFVPYLNIKNVNSGTSITNLGIDSNGNVVSGTTGSGGGNLFSLPVPNLKISNTPVVLETFDYHNNSASSGVTLLDSPVIVATDLSNEQINQGVWVEMLVYRKAKRKRNIAKTKKGMVVPPSWKWDSISMSGTNTFEDQILTICPTCVLPTRGGATKYFRPPTRGDLHITRPNHYKLTGVTESINVGNFLNGRFTYYPVPYRSPNPIQPGMYEQILLPVPTSRRNNNSPKGSARFCYRSELTPTYIKFRYIMFDVNLNGGQGGFITGPTTNTVKIMVKTFPFIPNEPFNFNGKYYPTCTVKQEDYTKLKCYIENNVP